MSESPTPGELAELDSVANQHWQKMQNYHALGLYPGNSKKESAAWRRMWKKARQKYLDAVWAWADARRRTESHQDGQHGPKTAKRS